MDGKRFVYIFVTDTILVCEETSHSFHSIFGAVKALEVLSSLNPSGMKMADLASGLENRHKLLSHLFHFHVLAILQGNRSDRRKIVGPFVRWSAFYHIHLEAGFPILIGIYGLLFAMGKTIPHSAPSPFILVFVYLWNVLLKEVFPLFLLEI